MLVESHKVFAKSGDPWDYRARREPKPAGLVIREVRGPNWHELTHRWEREGFAPDGEPIKVEPRKPYRDEVRISPRTVDQVRHVNEARRVDWKEPHEEFHHPEEIKGKAQPLTDEQMLIRKRQRAAVKARLTRAANRRAKQQEEVLKIILGL